MAHSISDAAERDQCRMGDVINNGFRTTMHDPSPRDTAITTETRYLPRSNFLFRSAVEKDRLTIRSYFTQTGFQSNFKFIAPFLIYDIRPYFSLPLKLPFFLRAQSYLHYKRLMHRYCKVFVCERT